MLHLNIFYSLSQSISNSWDAKNYKVFFSTFAKPRPHLPLFYPYFVKFSCIFPYFTVFLLV
jgi:hypothetical protein